jgi:two-component system cell cycle response regulator
VAGTATRNAASSSTILIVEDEAGIARMIQVLLEARGFSTLVCHTGTQALERLTGQSVDLVLLDLMMPGLDGFEVCRRLKADARWRHIPVIMLTAKDAVRDKILGLEIGADDYVTKPFNTDELVARIRVLLRIQTMSQELLRRNRELQTLNAVASAASRSLSLEEILDGVLTETLESLGAAYGLVHLVDARGGHLSLAAWRGLPGPPPEALQQVPPGAGWAWRALDQEIPLVLADAAKAEGLGASVEEAPRPLVAVPLHLHARKLGTLTVAGHPGQTISPDEVALLAAIGRQVAMALENANLYAESLRKAEEFEGLYQVGKATTSTFNLQEILTRISEAVSRLIRAKAMSLLLLSPDGRVLTPAGGFNWDEELPQTVEATPAGSPLNPSLVAVQEKRLVAIADLGRDPAPAPWLRQAHDIGYRALLAVPLIVQERALGCMNLYLTEPHEPDGNEVQLLSTFASQAAIAIDNARLFEETRKLAITDELTGLANHREFYQQLAREVRRAMRYERALTLLMVDVDFFKEYNDRYGHLVGDQALHDLAEVLRRNARDVDILARYGGEEFTMILPETDLNQAAFQGERIRAAVATHPFPGTVAEPEARLTVSIGAAALGPHIRKIEDLVRDADQAMYQAKSRGRNRLELVPAKGRGAPKPAGP